MKDDRLYVIHIGECLARIAQYIAGGRETFMHSPLIQDATLRNLQTIGQSVSRLSATLREEHPEVDWRSIIGLRNALVHDYLGINLERMLGHSRARCAGLTTYGGGNTPGAWWGGIGPGNV